MPTGTQLSQLYQELSLSEKAAAFVKQMRFSERVCYVRSAGGNVCSWYPSRKIQRSIQFKSRKIELPYVHEIEYYDNALIYSDHPP